MRPLKKQNQHQGVSLPRVRSAGTVRIIAGKWRRTPLAVSDLEGLRPTGDRVKETLFNWLNHIFSDFSKVDGLDMFAGSGALGFELASRGAQSVTLIEKNRFAFKKLSVMCEKLHAQDTLDLHCGDSLSLLSSLNKQFDIIFIDPPFALNLHKKAINTALPFLKKGGIIYVESPREWDATVLSDLQLTVIRQSDAGAVTFRLLCKKQE